MTIPVVKLNALVQFPARVEATTGIEVTKANGTYTFETDWTDFGAISAIPTSPTSYILTFDSATGVYVLVPSHLLGGATAGIADAPVDGVQYGRQNATWTPSEGSGFLQAGTGAVARTMQNKVRETVSITDFGAVGNASTLNTTTIQAALDSGAASVWVPDGIFCTGALTVPSTVKNFYGPGALRAAGTLSGFPTLVSLTSSTGCTIRDLTIDVDNSAYGNVTCIGTNSSSNITVENVNFVRGGRYSIHLVSSSRITIRACTFANFAGSAVSIQTVNTLTIDGCTSVSPTSPANVTHPFDLTQGVEDLTFINNHITGSIVGGGGFALSVGGYTSFGMPTAALIQGNTFIDTIAECIHAAGINLRILDNYAFWSPGVSIDFGMSFDDNHTGTQVSGYVIARNTIVGCGKSGISLSGNTGGFDIYDNFILNCNQLNDGALHDSGIDLYNSTSTGANISHTIHNNKFVRNTGSMKYGVRELTGGAASNLYWDNVIINPAVGEYNLLASSTVVRTFGGVTAYTAVAQSSGGAISAQTSNSWYMRIGKLVIVSIDVAITGSGGTGSVFIGVPVASVTSATGTGIEDGIDGLGLVATLAAGATQLVARLSSSSGPPSLAVGAHYKLQITYPTA